MKAKDPNIYNKKIILKQKILCKSHCLLWPPERISGSDPMKLFSDLP